MRFNTDWRVRISIAFQVKIKRKVLSCFCHANMRKKFPTLTGTFPGNHFVHSFLIVSSATIYSSVKNPIVKLSEHDGAFSVASSFRPETLCIYHAPLQSFITCIFSTYNRSVQLVSLAHVFWLLVWKFLFTVLSLKK